MGTTVVTALHTEDGEKKVHIHERETFALDEHVLINDVLYSVVKGPIKSITSETVIYHDLKRIDTTIIYIYYVKEVK